MFVPVTMFVLGLVIATVINRKFPRTLITEVLVMPSPNETGVFITNDEFVGVVEEVARLSTNCVIHVNHDNVLFVSTVTGRVKSLSLTNGWREITADYRKVGTRHTVSEPIDPTPVGAYIQ